MAIVSKINLNGETRDIADASARQSIATQGTTISQLQTALAGKQATLIPGDGIEIDSTTNVISATGGGGGGGSVTVDPALSTTSTNPVQNRVITGALQSLQPALTPGDNIEIDGNNIISAVIPTVTIDTEISATSPNAVANYVLARELKTQSDDIAANKALLEQHTIDILGITDDIADQSDDIARNKAAITILNGDDQTSGSVAKQIKDAVDGVDSSIGDLSDLTTTAQDTIVNAINEVDAGVATLNGNVTTVGSVEYKIQQAKLTKTKIVTAVPDVEDAEANTQYWVANADGTYDIYVKATNDVGEDVMLRSGNTEVDLTDYQTKDLTTSVADETTVEGALGALEAGITNLDSSKLAHVTSMPADPAADDVVLWVGETTTDYTKGMVYQYDGTEAEWKPISAADISVDDELSETSENPVQNKVVTEALSKLDKAALSVLTLPTASAQLENMVRFNVADEKWYLCVENEGEYEWKAITQDIPDVDLSKYSKQFNGTLAEWNALSEDEQAEYDSAAIDDVAGAGSMLTGTVEEGNENAVTSDAVAKAISGFASASDVAALKTVEKGNITLSNAVGTQSIQYAKNGNLLTLALSISELSAISKPAAGSYDSLTLGVLPTAYRPAVAVHTVVHFQGQSAAFTLDITTDGTVRIWQWGQTDTMGGAINQAVTYVCA